MRSVSPQGPQGPLPRMTGLTTHRYRLSVDYRRLPRFHHRTSRPPGDVRGSSPGGLHRRTSPKRRRSTMTTENQPTDPTDPVRRRRRLRARSTRTTGTPRTPRRLRPTSCWPTSPRPSPSREAGQLAHGVRARELTHHEARASGGAKRRASCPWGAGPVVLEIGVFGSAGRRNRGRPGAAASRLRGPAHRPGEWSAAARRGRCGRLLCAGMGLGMGFWCANGGCHAGTGRGSRGSAPAAAPLGPVTVRGLPDRALPAARGGCRGGAAAGAERGAQAKAVGGARVAAGAGRGGKGVAVGGRAGRGGRGRQG